MSGGRPRVYTAEIAERILGELMDGRSLTDVCRDAGMPAERTVRNWVADNYQDFAPRYGRAREVGFHVIADQILAIADDASDDCMERRKENGDIETTLNPVNVTRSRLRCDMRRWLLSKVLPRNYGDRLDPNAKQEVRDTLAEVLKEIDGRTRGLPNRPAIATLPAPQEDNTGDS
jgi:hypothetical protein